MSSNRLSLGYLEDRNLASLEAVERSIEAQFEFEHQISELDKREIELAKCFPDGKLVLRGRLDGLCPTVDPEVSRSYLIQDGKKRGILYINLLRKTCVAIDWFF